MAADARPPVSEVAIAIAFDAQPVLSTPQALITLGDLVRQYPQLEEQPTYEMPLELPAERQILEPARPQVRLIDTQTESLQHRYWLLNPADKSILIQIQSNYLAVNWRKTDANSNYIGFEELLQTFLATLSTVKDSVRKSGGTELAINQAEISYSNVIQPDDFWSAHPDVQKIFNFQAPALDDIEQLNLNYSRPMLGDAREFRGRLYCMMQTAFIPKEGNFTLTEAMYSDLKPVILVGTQVRSARQDKMGDQGAVTFITDAHEEAGKAFRTITNSEAQRHWGI